MKVTKRNSCNKKSSRSKIVSKRQSKKRISRKRVSKKRVSKKRVSKKRSSKKRSSKKRSYKKSQHGGNYNQYGAGFDSDLFHITSFVEEEKEKTILENISQTAADAADATVQGLTAAAGATRDLAVSGYNTVKSAFV